MSKAPKPKLPNQVVRVKTKGGSGVGITTQPGDTSKTIGRSIAFHMAILGDKPAEVVFPKGKK